MGLTSEYRKRLGRDLMTMKLKSIRAVKKAISEIKKANGSEDDLFIQVIDKSIFKEDDSEDNIYKRISDTIYISYGAQLETLYTTSDGKHIIVIGYTE